MSHIVDEQDKNNAVRMHQEACNRLDFIQNKTVDRVTLTKLEVCCLLPL